MKLRWMLVGLLLPVALVQPSDAMTRIAGDMGGPLGEYLLVFAAIRDVGGAGHDRWKLLFCLHAGNSFSPER
jgi:hypothetical protein